MRKVSYGGAGDYDSQLVDGKYLTTVPIVSIDAGEEEALAGMDIGNLRPLHRPSPKGLRNLKKVQPDNPADGAAARSRTGGGTSSTVPAGSRKVVSQSSVFDRLAPGGSSTGTLDRNESTRGSRRSLASTSIESSGYEKARNGSALTKIKDLTRNLRKGSKDGTTSSGGSNIGNNSRAHKGPESLNPVVVPRNSMSMFSNGKSSATAATTNLDKLTSPSRNSISSSTRSLHRQESSSSGNAARTYYSPMVGRSSTSTLGTA